MLILIHIFFCKKTGIILLNYMKLTISQLLAVHFGNSTAFDQSLEQTNFFTLSV